jgi:hypothetical protein
MKRREESGSLDENQPWNKTGWLENQNTLILNINPF